MTGQLAFITPIYNDPITPRTPFKGGICPKYYTLPMIIASQLQILDMFLYAILQPKYKINKLTFQINSTIPIFCLVTITAEFCPVLSSKNVIIMDPPIQVFSVFCKICSSFGDFWKYFQRQLPLNSCSASSNKWTSKRCSFVSLSNVSCIFGLILSLFLQAYDLFHLNQYHVPQEPQNTKYPGAYA